MTFKIDGPAHLDWLIITSKSDKPVPFTFVRQSSGLDLFDGNGLALPFPGFHWRSHDSLSDWVIPAGDSLIVESDEDLDVDYRSYLLT